jgi:hypothetical protein
MPRVGPPVYECPVRLISLPLVCVRPRKRLDAARKRYAVLKRKLETEFGELDTMESKVEELESMRKVSVGGRGTPYEGSRAMVRFVLRGKAV